MGFGIAALLGILQDYQERWKAERLLGVIQQIRVGSSDHASVIQMTLPFRQYRSSSEYRPGDELAFFFQNKWLHRLRLAPAAGFRVEITFIGGIVVDKRAWVMVSTTGCVAEVNERKRGFGSPDGLSSPPSHSVHASPDGSGRHVGRTSVLRMMILSARRNGAKTGHSTWPA